MYMSNLLKTCLNNKFQFAIRTPKFAIRIGFLNSLILLLCLLSIY
jgi:hypothetical protein